MKIRKDDLIEKVLIALGVDYKNTATTRINFPTDDIVTIDTINTEGIKTSNPMLIENVKKLRYVLNSHVFKIIN